MTKDDIIALPNPHLREKSARVGIITDEVLDVIRDMQDATINWDQSREHEVGAAQDRFRRGNRTAAEDPAEPVDRLLTGCEKFVFDVLRSRMIRSRRGSAAEPDTRLPHPIQIPSGSVIADIFPRLMHAQ